MGRHDLVKEFSIPEDSVFVVSLSIIHVLGLFRLGDVELLATKCASSCTGGLVKS